MINRFDLFRIKFAAIAKILVSRVNKHVASVGTPVSGWFFAASLACFLSPLYSGDMNINYIVLFFGLFFVVVAWAYFPNMSIRAKVVWFLLSVLFVIVEGCALSVYYMPAKITEFNWEWEPLSDAEIRRLVPQIEKGKELAVQIVCLEESCSKLETSLINLFSGAGWQISNAPINRYGVQNLSGLYISEMRAPFVDLRNIFAQNTDLRPAAFPQVQPPLAIAANLLIYIGSKPVPARLPPKIIEDITKLGHEMLQLGNDLKDFSRERDQQAPSDRNAKFDFNQNTDVLESDHFGIREAKAYKELQMIGIFMDFFVKNGSLKVREKFYRSIGDLLLDGKITEARKLAADESYWINP